MEEKIVDGIKTLVNELPEKIEIDIKIAEEVYEETSSPLFNAIAITLGAVAVVSGGVFIAKKFLKKKEVTEADSEEEK